MSVNNQESFEQENKMNSKKESRQEFPPFFNMQNLRRAAEFIKDLNIDDSEIDIIYDKARKLLKDEQFKQYSQKLIQNTSEEKNVNDLIKDVSETIETNELVNFMTKIAKDEEFLNFMQDFLLDKII